jgi:membrane-bound ClpP family serine protease
MPATSMNAEAQKILVDLLKGLEKRLDADVLSLFGPIGSGVDHKVRRAIEAIPNRRPKLAIILHTNGGLVELTERMVNTIRHFYREVVFIVPDVALSAGTVFVMSGDEIMMDYFSCLGPIDPQVERDGKLVPALSYLIQYDRLIEKAAAGTLTNAEFAILAKYDQAELHQFEMARDLSISLLKKWLTTYKFKDWVQTETRNLPVTLEYREARAEQVATLLMDNQRWGSHGRGIPMQVVRDELKLKVNDFGADHILSSSVRRYTELLLDLMVRNQVPHMAHTRGFI